jgi:hypothetical protein
MSFVQSRLEELVEGLLGYEMRVHPLATQHECTPRGAFKLRWCVLYAQAMTLGLVEALLAPPVQPPQRAEHVYLEAVMHIMHAFMRRRVRQLRGAGRAEELVARLTELLAESDLNR